MGRLGKIVIGGTTILVVGTFLAWVTSPDPRTNPATFEDDPLVEGVAPVDQAVTLAQFTDSAGSVRTILVTDFDESDITGIDLMAFGGTDSPDPFEALAPIDDLPQSFDEVGAYPSTSVPMTDLLPSGSLGDRHIGTGTNFPEHAEEANSGSVFSFPKFGTATPRANLDYSSARNLARLRG
ncbi:MAG: hypothetical protein AAF559_05655 [Pseudomonadota bacterium]